MSEWSRLHLEVFFPDAAMSGYGFDTEPKVLPGKRLRIAHGTPTYSTTEAGSRHVTPSLARSSRPYWLRPAHGRYTPLPVRWGKSQTVSSYPLRAIDTLILPACTATVCLPILTS